MKSLFIKIIAVYILSFVTFLTLIFFFSFNSIKKNYLNQQKSELNHIYNAYKSEIKNHITRQEYQSLLYLIKDVAENFDIHIVVQLLNENKILYSQQKGLINHNNKSDNSKSIIVFNKDEEDFLICSTEFQIYSEGMLISRIQFSIVEGSIQNFLNILAFDILSIMLIVFIVSIIPIIFFIKSIVDPIQLIAKASSKVADGDFDTKVSLYGKDEITNLADNFNYMTGRIKELFHEASLKKEEFNSIIAAIRDGLFVINSDDNIVLSNQGFKKIVNKKIILGVKYNSLIKDKRIIKLFEIVRNSKESRTIEIENNKRIYICSANWLESNSEIVAILYDITDFRQLEELKKDFITNVSHELRTPLTAIKGFIETMEDTITEDGNKHYLDIIHRHTDRLINIVRDLLILSELESKKTNLLISSIELDKLILNAIRIFEYKLEEKGLKLIVKFDNNLPEIKADSFKLEQVIINLLDNAIKYSEEGEIKIFVKKKNNFIEIVISDSGIGIPKDVINRIFDRFYTANKSRSRSVGGTGLGLSIVKHIILMHNGLIQVKSKQGKGSRFIISIPIEYKEV